MYNKRLKTASSFKQLICLKLLALVLNFLNPETVSAQKMNDIQLLADLSQIIYVEDGDLSIDTFVLKDFYKEVKSFTEASSVQQTLRDAVFVKLESLLSKHFEAIVNVYPTIKCVNFLEELSEEHKVWRLFEDTIVNKIDMKMLDYDALKNGIKSAFKADIDSTFKITYMDFNTAALKTGTSLTQ